VTRARRSLANALIVVGAAPQLSIIVNIEHAARSGG
jgi:hypothetical protein